MRTGVFVADIGFMPRLKFLTTFAFASAALAAAVNASDLPPSGAREVDFAKDIQPILEEHCFDCHGEDSQKHKLRLDTTLGILRGGESGESLVVAGKSAESYLLKRVASENKKETMPPIG